MAALTPVVSVEALLGVIEKSTLLSAESLAKAQETAAALNDPKVAARALVKDGTLTRWQADQLLHGFHRLVVGKYKLLDQLGTSPTGRMYLAEHVQIGRRHALKVLAKRLARNPEAVARFLKGAQNACGLDHKNISHVYDVNQERLGHYVVMEYVDGINLELLVEKSGPLKLPQALEYVAQAAEGLLYAHSHGVVHGDLKPANLVRDNSGVIKILEIGQDSAGAQPETEDADDDIETAALAAVIFQAPEMRGDGEAADIACDVYSLGSVLSFLLTGKAAKNAATAAANLEANKEISADVVHFCRNLMADSPAERPRSVDLVLSRLQKLGGPATRTARPTSSEEGASAGKKQLHKLAPVGDAEKDLPATVRAPPGGGGMPIVAIAETMPPVVPPPVEGFSIQTRGRPRKGGRLSAESRGPIAALLTRYPPLVVAGAIGGAVVFAFGIVTLVVLLVAANRTAKPVVNATETRGQIAQPVAEENTVIEKGANPAAVELNSEVAIAPAAAPTLQNPAVTAPAAEATAATVVAPAPTATGPTPVVAVDAPAAVVIDAVKAAAPTGGMAKKTAIDPFQGFPSAVNLPPLPEGESPIASAFKPVSLGPCDVEADTPVSIALLGGDTAIRAPKQKFELHAREGQGREWDVLITGTSEDVVVASLSVNNGKLLFQWTEEGAKQPLIARQLSNCALALGNAKQTVALRMPVKGQPLVIDIERPSSAVRWSIGSLPPAKQIFVEVTGTDGFNKLKQDPKDATSVGEAVTISTGPAEKSTPLLFKFNITSTAATIDVRSQTLVKIDGWSDVRPLRSKDLAAMEVQQVSAVEKTKGDLRKAKDSRPRAEEEKAAREATIKVLAKEETAMLTVLEQLRYVLGFARETEGAAKVHFRVYCLAGDAKIELLRTDSDNQAK